MRSEEKPVSLTTLLNKRAAGEKLAWLTCYDAAFAAVLQRNGVDALLVGDSLGMVLQGHTSTLPVTLDHMAYHVGCVARGAPEAFIVADLPFATFQASPAQALESSARLMAAGAHMVKLEGGVIMAETVAFLVARGIPVCGHVGLTPQSVNAFGGYRVQGRTEEGAGRVLADARALADAGASFIVLELIPSDLARRIDEAIATPTIGIGAGSQCAGQVLVLHDMLGLNPKPPRFVRNFMDGVSGIEDAVRRYVAAVKDGSFPEKKHSYED